MNKIKTKLIKYFTQNISGFIRKRSHQFRNKDLLSKISRVIYLICIRILYAKNDDSIKADVKNINIFVVAWGSYVDLFFKYSLPSLLQDGNLKWIKNNFQIEIDFYTNIDRSWVIKKYPEMEVILNDYNFKFKNVNSYLDKDKKLSPDVQINIYKDQIRKSLNNYATCIVVNPDMVYSDASLKNIMLINKGKNFCYSFIHPRVNMSSTKIALEKFRDENNLINISSKKLVRLAWENLHDLEKCANDELDINITTRGKSWRKIDDKTIIVINSVVNPQIWNWKQKDLDYMSNLDKLSETDRAQPSYLLSDSRIRFITSSEILFAIELTDENENMDAQLVDNLYNDQPSGTLTHSEFASTPALLTWTMD